jgi:hypothetical protein
MEVLANAAEVLQILNTTTSHLSHAVEAARSQIFSCFVLHAIAVNPIAAFVKFTPERSEPIVVKAKRPKNPTIHLLLQVNALAQPRKDRGVKTEPPIPMAAATITKFYTSF